MTPRPPEPDAHREPGGHAGVARELLKPDPAGAADWDEERMRAARPREIQLGPDGTRRIAGPTDTTAEPPEDPE